MLNKEVIEEFNSYISDEKWLKERIKNQNKYINNLVLSAMDPAIKSQRLESAQNVLTYFFNLWENLQLKPEI